jgi:ATP-dependent Clp protease ATP-binding subunit ClpC
MATNKMERFTQRARRVLNLAQEAAEDLKHHNIDTEHMLLGLLREEGGIAGHVLRDLGLADERVEELVKELTQAATRSDEATFELSPGTKRILELAVDEARRMGHHYIGTEHLMLGLVRHTDGVANDVLKRLGVSPEDVRRQTRRRLQESPEPEPATPEVAPQPESAPMRRPMVHGRTFELMQTVIDKILEMVGKNDVTIERAKELLGALQPEIDLMPGETAQLASRLIQPGAVEKRRLRVIFTHHNTPSEFTMGLEAALRNIDLLLNAVIQNQDTKITFDDSESNTRIEVQIEDNPAESSE